MVGCRYKVYASYALEHPELVKLIAVSEPRAHRRKVMSRLHSCVLHLSSTLLFLFHFEAHPPLSIRIPPENQYESWEPLLARGRIADALLITVLDDLHAELVSAFAPLGYHILCEKPMATSVQDCVKMVKEVELSGAGIFGIGHVLRYSPYNRAVKEVIDSGVLGEIVNIQVSNKTGWVILVFYM